MTEQEIDNIAWELYKIIDAVDNVKGVDRTSEITNTAIEAVHNISKKYPRIKQAIKEFIGGK